MLGAGRVTSVGIGGIRFRRLTRLAGVPCFVLVLGCQSGREQLDLRSQLLVSGTAVPGPSFVLGHRFGRWLEVEPEPAARAALEDACLVEQTGSAEDAIGVLSEAIDDVRDCASLFQARGALYLGTGFPRAAAGDFQRAVNLAPEQGHGWYALGHAYEVLGLYHQSLDALGRALDLGETHAPLFLSLARAYRGLGRAGLSARHYELTLAWHDGVPAELLVEAVLLVIEDPARAAGVEALRDRIETCSGTKLSDDAWLLRALVRELPGEPPENVSATFRALEVAPAELAALTRGLLAALQLDDPETASQKLAELLAAETDRARRAALERCLSAPRR
jgi:tetratricopeptide (TPR) repeat protein